jgi:hypothetical protein
MTVHTTQPTETTVVQRRRSNRIGGFAALVQAATFVVGIAMFATMLTDYTDADATPAESVAFVVGHQGALLVWYLVIFAVFAVALVPLVLSLHRRLRDRAPELSAAAAAFGLIWSGLIFATGMISNIGLRVVDDLATTDPEQAEAVWSSLDAVTNGLGGGNELVGAIWVLLVSVAALRTDRLPRALNLVGIAGSVAGLATLVPGTEAAEIVFGLALIVWFAWLGTVLLRDRDDRPGRAAVR